MFVPSGSLTKFEQRLEAARRKRLPRLAEPKADVPRSTKCPLNVTHLKLKYLPSDCSPKDSRVIKYQGPQFIDINSELSTGLESYQQWSRKKWKKIVADCEFVKSETLRSEALRQKILDLTQTALDFKSTLIGTHLCQLIYGSIRFNKQLQSCDVSENCLTTDGIKPLMNALEGNLSVGSLNLSQNYLSVKGATVVSEMLKRNRCLKILKLSDCQLTDHGVRFQGIISLRIALEIHPTLKYLDVSGNMLGGQGVLILIEALCENYTLDTIDFSRNNYKEPKQRDSDLPGPMETLLEKASHSILQTRSRMKVNPKGELKLLFHDNATKLDDKLVNIIAKGCRQIFKARVKRMLDIEGKYTVEPELNPYFEIFTQTIPLFSEHIHLTSFWCCSKQKNGYYLSKNIKLFSPVASVSRKK